MQPNNFAILTAAVRFSKNITDRQKLLYAEITALSNRHGYCYATNKYIADLYGRSQETISRDIKALSDANFVRLEYDSDNTRRIYPLMDSSRPSCRNGQDPLVEMVKTPIDETVKHNNISINSINKNNNSETDFLTDANEVLLHLIELTGQDWKPNNKRFITEALKNGYTKEDLIEIIDLKQFQTEKINQAGRPAFDAKWMTPQTLFKNQVEKYHNEVQLIKQGKTKANPYETQQDRQQQKRDKLRELGVDPFELFGFKRDAEDNRPDVQ